MQIAEQIINWCVMTWLILRLIYCAITSLTRTKGRTSISFRDSSENIHGLSDFRWPNLAIHSKDWQGMGAPYIIVCCMTYLSPFRFLCNQYLVKSGSLLFGILALPSNVWQNLGALPLKASTSQYVF